MNLYVAIPSGFNITVASKCVSVQRAASASQNWIGPRYPPPAEVTFAVNVIVVPDGTLLMAVPLLSEMVRVVVVGLGLGACATQCVRDVQIATRAASTPYDDWKSFDWIERVILDILCGSKW
jgi:hypothetical protein